MPNKQKAFAIIHHSPIDVLSILPVGTATTFHPEERAKVLLCRHLPENYEADIALIFCAEVPDGLTVLDETKPGEIRTLTTKAIDQIFLKSTKLPKLKPKKDMKIKHKLVLGKKKKPATKKKSTKKPFKSQKAK